MPTGYSVSINWIELLYSLLYLSGNLNFNFKVWSKSLSLNILGILFCVNLFNSSGLIVIFISYVSVLLNIQYIFSSSFLN